MFSAAPAARNWAAGKKAALFEKSAQKLLSLWSREVRAPVAERNQSFFVHKNQCFASGRLPIQRNVIGNPDHFADR